MSAIALKKKKRMHFLPFDFGNVNIDTLVESGLGCKTTTVFNGRIPYNNLDIKLGLEPEWKRDANEELADGLQKRIAEIHQSANDNLMQSYLKYKR